MYGYNTQKFKRGSCKGQFLPLKMKELYTMLLTQFCYFCLII